MVKKIKATGMISCDCCKFWDRQTPERAEGTRALDPEEIKGVCRKDPPETLIIPGVVMTKNGPVQHPQLMSTQPNTSGRQGCWQGILKASKRLAS